MKKIAIVENNRIKRVVVCEDPSTIELSPFESIHEVEGKVRRGDIVETEQKLHEPVVKPAIDVWLQAALGAAVAAAGLAAYIYF